MVVMPKLCLTQDPEADRLIEEDPFALLMGMLLDQQVWIRRQLRCRRIAHQREAGIYPGNIIEIRTTVR
jgi:hypothetical protein